MMSSAPFVIVDGSSYLFRAYHALPNLTSPQGKPTGAILGVMNMLRKILEDYQPTNAAVIFDAKGKTFRHDIYPDYKANRPPMPPELAAQIEPLHTLIQSYGLPLYSQSGVEADDVIGTLAHQITQTGQNVLISTGDKDMAQLVNDKITLIDTMSNRLYTPDSVEAKFGVKPEQIIDYLALVGDTSDNIPGVPKVGPKTAAKWLNQYGTMENLITHANDISGKIGENLRAFVDQLPRNRELTTIRADIEIPLDYHTFTIKTPNTDTFLPQLKTHGFNQWLKAYDQTPAEGPSYETILTQADWDHWYQKLQQAPALVFDCETTNLNTHQAQLVGMAFSTQANEGMYVPLAHDYLDAPEQLPFDQTLKDIKTLLENPRIQKIGQNLKYDIEVLQKYDITVQNIAFDTMLASYILESGQNRHDMDTLAKKHLGRDTIHYEDVAGKGAKQIPFNYVAVEQAAPYAAEDADITFALYEVLSAALAQTPALEKVFYEIEMPLLQVLAQVEMHGVLIDAPTLLQQSQSLAESLAALEAQIYDYCGSPFNINSPKQLQTILYDKMQLPVIKKTPSGTPSTAEEVLQTLGETHELPQWILSYRHFAKLKSTYTDKLPTMIEPKTGRVHTNYHQAVASTGRLSSSDPNLQNIPIRTDAGRAIRAAFVAPAGSHILAADYSQIELRIMAHLSGDAGLLEAFAQNQDIHRATAAEVFDVAPEAVTADMRRGAKAINFGLIYGMSAFGLAKQLGIERDEAQTYIDTYFKRYPGVQAYMDRTRDLAQSQGYVETIFGRRLYLPEINAKNGLRRKAAERAAINAPMQGSCADIIKRAMLSIAPQLPAETHMIMQVHDELVFEVPEGQLDAVTTLVVDEMMGAASLSVPLRVDTGVGKNWDEAH